MNKKKLRKMITVSSRTTSSAELLKNVTIKGRVRTKKPGKYKITFTVTDPRTLLSKSLKVTYTVKKAPQEPAEAPAVPTV